MKSPTPEHEIKYLIACENKTSIKDASDSDIDRLIDYFQSAYPQVYEDAIRGSHFSSLFYMHSQTMNYQDAIRLTLISVTCLDIKYLEISARIQQE